MHLINDKRHQFYLWRVAFFYSLPVIIFTLGWFYYWFVLADRYTIFLYYHDMGALVPDTTPFSFVTASRYWMAGLVVNGGVLILYTMFSGILGWTVKRYRPPAWWRVWTICVVFLTFGIPVLTMNLNTPTLPFRNAVQVTAVTLIGLVLALIPGQWAVERPLALVLLGADGFGLMLILLNLVHLEKLGRWIARGNATWIWMMVIMLMVGLSWLGIMTILRVFWARKFTASGGDILLAGLCVSYLVMPLVHHVMGTDGYFYITNSDNFFAQSLVMQVGVWLMSIGIAFGVARLRKYLSVKSLRQQRQ